MSCDGQRNGEKALLTNATKSSKITDLFGPQVAYGGDGGASSEDRERRPGEGQQ